MSKADGWEKKDAFTWRKSGETFRAEIGRYTGTFGTPYIWDVYPLPRKDHIAPDGRFRKIGEGRCAKLAEAKEKADAAIDEWTHPTP